MDAKELSREVQKPMYDNYPYSRMKDQGAGMEIVERVINGYWRERFLINHQSEEAYQLMNRNLKLTFITRSDVDWEGVKTLDNNGNAYTFSAYYQRFAVERFNNGVALVKWTLHPDGYYFMDEDGYGMEDDDESALYGFIDRKARVVLPFQAKSWRKMNKQRTEAERRAREMK